MRRLATQTRGGAVRSNRDYQLISELGHPVLWSPIKEGQCSVKTTFRTSAGNCAVGGTGAYVAADNDTQLTVLVLDANKAVICKKVIAVDAQLHWNRIGCAWLVGDRNSSEYTIDISWHSSASIWLWGFSCDNLQLPASMCPTGKVDQDFLVSLNLPHLAPEAFYLIHDSAICGEHTSAYENVLSSNVRRHNPGKKCSQCQRALPVDPKLSALRLTSDTVRRAPQSMVLAFHGHRSKLSGYQNECRACKKFEINDHFNPIRTSDQLHESSVLTRERKLLLRESQILQDFKDRNNKRGLRYAIWERFNGRCFKCQTEVSATDYELDHTRPLAYLWPIDEHATCLCSNCNNQKSDHFPVDFYSRNELERLSKITGLSYPLLSAKTINEEQLRRIRADLSVFAKDWGYRLFCSVASRVKETNPGIDLFAELKSTDSAAYNDIIASMAMRPASILDDEQID